MLTTAMCNPGDVGMFERRTLHFAVLQHCSIGVFRRVLTFFIIFASRLYNPDRAVLETVIYTILRGLAIGLIISAPMGPVGMLCIQRTLSGGRRSGFYTGVGAAISDLVYCLLTGLGLSFVEDFLTKNQNVIQIAGSLVLVAFGVYLLKKKPDTNLGKRGPLRASAKKSILAGFLFTFSNPLILFLIIGLFAQLNFIDQAMQWGHYILGYVCIFAGAIGWWWMVTFFVDKARTRFSVKTMVVINKAIGIIILLFAAVSIVTAATAMF